uniref:Uncharacterized protein n=1 Tax=viral metagenome TaxID=1070528 RepID=A0A6M3LDN3_9ZZZZ
MNKNVPPYILFLFIIPFFLLLGFLGWKLERWINWKWDYGQRVEQRIEQVEQRLDRLENQNAKD